MADKLKLTVDSLAKLRVYDIKLGNIKSVDGKELRFGHLCYTLINLPGSELPGKR